jgi:sulfur carrier protein
VTKGSEVEVQVNGDWRAVPEGTTVAGLLESVGATARGVAVALNGEVVQRSAWAEVIVPPGAKLEILTAVQGG